ncbi:hypothetical protein NHX12_025098 [Muraenolepis orangiensis]|uniref:Kelch domain-containing protein 1 n=1 Tax=Muraenolepis orangiensis TaxID=630683 RepID=A0A9Q0EKM8_9TELE|nr:hypothetical protein NHX12_025098 [Muraenolepis orangiensis]
MEEARPHHSMSRLERSDHTAFIHHNVLYVWGGYQEAGGEDSLLPGDEIWLCDLDSGKWECRAIEGDTPSEVTGACGSFLGGSLYVFAGRYRQGYTNQFFRVDLTEARYTWRRITDAKGTTPSPRNKHTCWVHTDRLIYFGGYCCKTTQEVRATPPLSFIVEETSWTAIGPTFFRCWGWNNEVNVFDTQTHTWSSPETQGPAPSPRGSHSSAVLGTRGFICGGLDTLDLYSLDLETWTWTYYDLSSSCVPIGRSMHTLTPTSDHTLLLYGGLGVNEEGVDDSRARSDAWQFDTLTKEWSERTHHPHHDKPRLWHSACRGEDDQVVVFGGSRDCCFLMDSVVILRSPLQSHCKDVFVFQTQPSSLSRLSEDAMARDRTRLTKQLPWLPQRMLEKLCKRLAYFSSQQPGALTEQPGALTEQPGALTEQPGALMEQPGATS